MPSAPVRLFTLSAIIAMGCAVASAQPAAKPSMAKICTTCHTPEASTLFGNWDSLVFQNGSFQMKLDESTEVLRFDKAALKVKSKESAATLEETLKAIKKGHEVQVKYTEAGGQKTATQVLVKPPVSLAKEEVISLEEVEKLVAQGPEKGKYFLFDSRPAPRYQEGSIPTAVNLPFPAFDKMVDKLPADKGAFVVFFCSGKTCNMSPGSLKKAQKLGYTNAKVFVDGMPAWYSKHAGVIAPKHFQEVFTDKGMPAVVVDLRGKTAEEGALAGAMAADPAKVAELLKVLPPAKLKPPILVVDQEGGPVAVQLADQVAKAGYPGVNVLAGGMKAWTAAGLTLAKGPLAAKATFVPKPKPGSISPQEFTKLVEVPAEQRTVTVLDVRNPDETKNGVIKGSLQIPEPQVAARVAEISKDRKVLVHCATGTRAEMAYNTLKDKGYQVAFLNAEIAILDTGEFIAD